MATAAYERQAIGSDHKLFLSLAIAMAATIFIGFSVQLAMGRSSFAVPLHVHVHALVFFGWTVLYVLQTGLIAAGSQRLHRRLGWLGVSWMAAIVVVGIYTTVVMVREGRAPFFFTPGEFLVMNPLSVLTFGALGGAAVAMRRRTDWHRRLMTCGMAVLTGPAFGRLLPMPFLIPHAELWVFGAVLLFPLVGVVADRRMRGRVHPAWSYGFAALAAMQIGVTAIPGSALGDAIYARVTAGSPAAAIAPDAYPPNPMMP